MMKEKLVFTAKAQPGRKLAEVFRTAPVLRKSRYRAFRNIDNSAEHWLEEALTFYVWSLEGMYMVFPKPDRCKCLETRKLGSKEIHRIVSEARAGQDLTTLLRQSDWDHASCPFCATKIRRPFYKLIRLIPDNRIRDFLLGYDSDLEDVLKTMHPSATLAHFLILKEIPFRRRDASNGVTVAEVVKRTGKSDTFIRNSTQFLAGELAGKVRDEYGRPFAFLNIKIAHIMQDKTVIRQLTPTDIGQILLKYL